MRLQRIRQHAARNIWIAPANDYQITQQPAVVVNFSFGFNRGAEAIIRPGDGQRGSGGKKLGVRSRKKKLVGILRIERLARVQIDDVNAPMRAIERRLAQNRRDFLG